MIGALAADPLAGRYGRKILLCLSGIFFATGALISLPMLTQLGASLTLWIFTAICAGLTVVSFYMAETKGKSLEEAVMFFRECYARQSR